MTEGQYTEFVRGLESAAAKEFRPTVKESRLQHGILGLVTEAAELADALKKLQAYGKPIDETNIVEELGDLEFYLSLVRDAIGVSRDEVINANFKKLESRYPGGFNAERAMRRDLNAERNALEDAREAD